jgi:S-adenosylhomocysteine hydrolase
MLRRVVSSNPPAQAPAPSDHALEQQEHPRSAAPAAAAAPAASARPEQREVFELVPARRLDSAHCAAEGVSRVRALGAAEETAIAVTAANVVRGQPQAELVRLAEEALAVAARAKLAGAAEPVATLRSLRADGDWPALAATTLLAWALEHPHDSLSRRVASAAAEVELLPAGHGNDLPGIGDFQNRWVERTRSLSSKLLSAVVRTMPELQERLPALELTAARLAREYGQPLAGVNTVVIGHILAEAPAFMESLAALGNDPSTTHVLAVPYSSSDLAVVALADKGIDAQNPDGASGRHEGRWGVRVDANVAFRDVTREPFDVVKKRAVAEVLRQALADHAKNGKPLLVIDDGGFAAVVAREQYPNDLHLFRFVEQTTRGVRQIASLGELPCPVVNVAESHVKKVIEGPFVAAAIADALRLELTAAAGGTLKGKRITLLGYGTIGRAAAQLLREQGAVVTAFDPRPEAEALAARDGIAMAADKQEALSGRDFVVGATGTTSIDPEEFAFLDGGTTLVSLSSTDVEYRDAWLKAEAMGLLQKRAVSALHTPPALPPLELPSKLGVSVRVDLPGSKLDGTWLAREQLQQNRVTRAFVGSLADSARQFGGVSIKATAALEFMPSGYERLLEAITPAPAATPTPVGRERDPAAEARARLGAMRDPIGDPWRQQLTEGMVELREERDPIWILNGGYPVNLSRRLITMPPERIQITMAALLAGAVQATTRRTPHAGADLQPLDPQLEAWVEEDFKASAPAQHAYSLAFAQR